MGGRLAEGAVPELCGARSCWAGEVEASPGRRRRSRGSAGPRRRAGVRQARQPSRWAAGHDSAHRDVEQGGITPMMECLSNRGSGALRAAATQLHLERSGPVPQLSRGHVTAGRCGPWRDGDEQEIIWGKGQYRNTGRHWDAARRTWVLDLEPSDQAPRKDAARSQVQPPPTTHELDPSRFVSTGWDVSLG